MMTLTNTAIPAERSRKASKIGGYEMIGRSCSQFFIPARPTAYAVNGLTKAVGQLGMQIAFGLPKGMISGYTGPVKILSAEGTIKTEEVSELENVSFHGITSPLRPYIGFGEHQAYSQHRNSHRTRGKRHAPKSGS